MHLNRDKTDQLFWSVERTKWNNEQPLLKLVPRYVNMSASAHRHDLVADGVFSQHLAPRAAISVRQVAEYSASGFLDGLVHGIRRCRALVANFDSARLLPASAKKD